MTERSNPSRPDQLLHPESSILAPHLITVSPSANNASPTGNVTPPRSVAPLIVRAATNSATNLSRNLVFIRPSNATLATTPRFVVQSNSLARPILPQTVISQPIASSSLSSTPNTQPEPPRVTARAALLRNASIPVPLSNKSVPRSFELRYTAIPGPESDVTSAVIESVARLRSAAPQSDDEGKCLSGEIIKRMQIRVCPRPNQKFSILRYNYDRIDLYGDGGSKSSGSSLPEVFIQRENNLRQYKASHNIPDGPNRGAGSEFGQDAREEARMRRLGISRQGYRAEDQPWLLTVGKGRTAKRYRGVKEGGVSANVGHFIFCQNSDESFNAYPVDEWYKLNPEISYRYLRDEEAEAEYSRRHKTMNLFNVMINRKLADEKGKEDEEGGNGAELRSRNGGRNGSKGDSKLSRISSSLVLTELDEWKAYGDDDDDDEEEEDEDNILETAAGGDGEGGELGADGEKKVSLEELRGFKKKLDFKKKRAATIISRKRRAMKQRARRRRKGVVPHSSDEEDDPFEEAIDESDLDDHEGDEVDYMTDSSSDEDKLSEEDREQIYLEQGVDEEAGLRTLLTDISESEEDENKDKKDQEEEGKSNGEDEESDEDGGHKSRLADSKNRREGGASFFNDDASVSDSSSDSSSSSGSDSDVAPDDPAHLARKVHKKTELLHRISDKVACSTNFLQSSEDHVNSGGSVKRPLEDSATSAASQPKRFKPTPNLIVPAPNTPTDDAFVAAVRKYLMRKPISLPDLLKKMKSKRLLPQSGSSQGSSGRISTDDVAETMLANALRQLRPMKQIINGQSFLSLKR